MARGLPPKGFGSSKLELAPIKTGTKWFRLYSSRYPAALGFGFSSSRFSDPRIKLPEKDRFGVIYFGSSLKVCFLERVLRDLRNGQIGDVPIPYAELEQLVCAEVTIDRPLNAVDLRGDWPVKMRVPTDAVRASNHRLGHDGRLPSGFTSSALTEFFILLDSTRRFAWLYTMWLCPMCAYLKRYRS